ncbi:YceI family protein [Aggregatimonas sangjinii]|uniref:YceI family protein n=1 Tax=Aggregatimonas sangjinii TaxID=2583587 RepID=A0A5B7SSY7_9FLAO|nr:YceI family protein [Aggregatimonas sangjinii]QCW99959.1 YceI family protein [Aggregatimonas sangjinii]
MPLSYSKKLRSPIAGIYTIVLVFFLLVPPFSLFGQTPKTISSAEITFIFISNDTDGSISGFSSSSTIDTENPSNSVFKGEVKAETLETGNFLRNWSLRGSKYFDVDTYPTITFTSTSVSETGSGYSVKGNLTIKDVTKPITISFTRNGKKLTGTTTLYASDFGINIKKKREDNKVSVKMVFQLN